MRYQKIRFCKFLFAFLLAGWFCAASALSQEEEATRREATPSDSPTELPTELLTAAQQKQVDLSVDRALKWLASRQRPDGSFPSIQGGQPGATGLCVMAFLAQGYLPGEGEYGENLKRSLDYIISCQKRNGLLAAAAPDHEKISRFVPHQVGYPLGYNHGIAGLVLSECYGMVGPEQSKKIEPAIQKAIAATCQMQDFRKDRAHDEGGWRYLDDIDAIDADLSVTGWHLMFLRSAKNAGFDVQQRRIDLSVKYVQKCFIKERGAFTYKVGDKNRTTRGMAGAGVLALAHAGLHKTPEAIQSGDFILKSGFHDYNDPGRVNDIMISRDRYHYGLLTCSQAMYQLGGRHWREFFPPTMRVLIANQNKDGSWPVEKVYNDKIFGNAYTTAIGVITLSTPNELLPIFQR